MATSARGGVALPDNPVGARITGVQAPKNGRLPDSPVSQHITGRHTLAPGGLEQLQQMTEKASAPAVADYNRRSHGTQGIVPGMKAEDLAQIRALAKQHPDLAGVIPSLTDPVAIGAAAVKGVGQIAHGVGQIAHGHIGKGAENAALGGLAAASVVPFGKGASFLRDAGLIGRTEGDAAAHIAEVQAQAKAEGFGAHVGSKGHPPLVAKGAVTEATGGELGQTIREALTRAPSVRKAQNAGYSEERTARFKAAGQARVQAGGGLAGQAAAKRHLADALPKEFFGDWKHLTTAEVDQLARHIENAPLLEGEKTHAIDSLRNAVENGVVPTKGDQAILERVFGRVEGAPVEGEKSTNSFWDKAVSYMNIPRAIRSSLDVSAGFRQGLVVLVTHPDVWRRAWVKSLRQFGSENYYQATQQAIRNDPWFPVLEKWKVPFTDASGKVANAEEAFIGGQAAEHLHELPGIKGTPLSTVLRPASNLIRRSDRAFTGFQNEVRFQLAKQLGEKAALLGHDLNDQKLGESIGKVVGTFSGRGVTPKILEGHLTTLNALMFSPRLMAARLNLLSPVYYAKLDPFARAEALRGARNLVAAIGTVMLTAKMLGAQVEFDPRSSNFAKIKVGNTRIDIAGGFSQYVRLIAQEMTRTAISSNGTRTHITAPFSSQVGTKGTTTDLANLTKFVRSKAAPIPGMLWDVGSGKDFIGRPIHPGSELGQNAPFITQDVKDAYQNSGSKSVWIAGFLSAIGFGVQSYKDKPVVGSSGGPDPFGGGSGGFGGGSGGFGNSGSGFGG